MRFLVTALAVFSVSALASEEPAKFDAKADLERLQGVWQTDKAAKVTLRLEVRKHGLGFQSKVGNSTTTLEAIDIDVFELKEVKGKRVLELNEISRLIFNSGPAIEYRFDKESLTVTIPEGDLKGEYKLTKAKK